MEGKLIKRNANWYVLTAEDGSTIASTAQTPYKKLSLKSCQAIENGYDLDELAEKYFLQKYSWTGVNNLPYKEEDVRLIKENFVAGAKVILEILGDKRFQFTKEELVKLLVDFVGFPHPHDEPRGSISERFVQSLQQTEWDVEIEMEDVFIKNNEQYIDESGVGNYSTHSKKPKLDKDGCLILKRKS